jgi:hypothetical protein
MIKKSIVLMSMLLAGCASVDKAVDAYLMKYDNNEYNLINEIRTTSSLAKDDCGDVALSKANSDNLYRLSLTLKNYAENLPHNGPVQKSSVDLFEITNGLNKQYKSGEKVSEVFCRIKMNSIETNATTIQKMEGSKPK